MERLSIAEKQLLVITLGAGVALVNERRKKRSIWTKKWLKRRALRGSYAMIFRELKAEDSNSFLKYLRMEPAIFNFILNKVAPFIKKQDTVLRESISAGARLEATLLWMAQGGSYAALSFTTRISKQSLSVIIPETCTAIYEALKRDYMRTPRTANDWQAVASDFERKWNFPNCIGSVDGKHILIRPPADSGSYYFNYKGSHSIILLAVVDANYRFLYVDIGKNGRASDSTVWEQTALKLAIDSCAIKIPAERELPHSNKSLPYVFVGDDAFALSKNMMKPYPFSNQTYEQRIFSYRLSRARRTVENAFGILANRFRIFLAPINLHPHKVEKIVLAATVLHNVLVSENMSEYMPSGSIDREDINSGEIQQGSWRRETPLLNLNSGPRKKSPTDAKRIREQYCYYFNNEGKIDWQDRMLGD